MVIRITDYKNPEVELTYDLPESLSKQNPLDLLQSSMLGGMVEKLIKNAIPSENRHLRQMVHLLKTGNLKQAMIACQLAVLKAHSDAFIKNPCGKQVAECLRGVAPTLDLENDPSEELAVIPGARNENLKELWNNVNNLIATEYVQVLANISVGDLIFTVLRLGYA